MSYSFHHFRGSEAIFREKNLSNHIYETLQYLDTVLAGSLSRGRLMKSALDDYSWRDADLAIIPGRKYQYKGLHKRVAIEGNLYAYEYILEGLVKLQIGYAHGNLDAGILILTSQRGQKSRLGPTEDLVRSEIEALRPTITVPVTVALFDLGLTTHEDIQSIHTASAIPAVGMAGLNDSNWEVWT